MNKENYALSKATERWHRRNLSRVVAISVAALALLHFVSTKAISQETIRIVKAKVGDTVKKVADREKVDAVKLAEYNGLLPDSVLGVGREIKIPVWATSPQRKLSSPPMEHRSSSADSKTPAKSAKSTSVGWDVRPFGFSLIDDLPPRYSGHSYEDVMEAIGKINSQLVKDEFETTYEYNKRLAKLRSHRLVGSLTHDDRLAFNFLPHQGGFHASYDADRQSLDFIIEWARNSNYLGQSGEYVPRFYTLTWSDNSRKVGSYVGRNIFNRAVPVSVYKNYIFHLASEETLLTKFSPDRSPLGIVIHCSAEMPASLARSAKSNARLLVVGRLAKLPLVFATDRSEPTFQFPRDEHILSFGMNFVVEEIWVYDFPTGRVWARIGPR